MLAEYSRRLRLAIRRRQSRFWGSAALLVGSSVLAQLMTVASMPLVTRLFSAEQIGAISVFIAFLAMPSVCATMRYEGALLLARDDAESVRIKALATWSVAGVAILSGALLAGFRASGVFGLAVLPWWSALAAVPVVHGLGMSAVFRAARIRRADFTILAATAAIRNSSNIAVRLVGGAFGAGTAALLAAEVVAAWASMRRLAGAGVRATYREVRGVPLGELRETARRWIRFPAYETPSMLLDQLAAGAPLLIIADRLGPGPAGLFAIAYRVATLPNVHLGAAVGDVFRSSFAGHVRADDVASARRLYGRLLVRAMGFSALYLVPTVLLAPRLFGFVFGAAWKDAGGLVPWIAAWAATMLIVSPLSPLLQILQRQNLKWIYDVSALLAMILAAVFVAGGNLGEYTRALAMAGIASNAVYLVILTVAVRDM